MDFDDAVGTHSKWKRKLRHYVAKHDGSLRPADVSLDTNVCWANGSIAKARVTHRSRNTSG